MSGIRDYSFNYFLPEIKDELVGYIDEIRFNDFLKLISANKQREFSFEEIQKFLGEKGSFSSEETKDILYCLYECSAVTNKLQGHNAPRFASKYRNRHSTLDIQAKIIIHQGLWKSLNLL